MKRFFLALVLIVGCSSGNPPTHYAQKRESCTDRCERLHAHDVDNSQRTACAQSCFKVHIVGVEYAGATAMPYKCESGMAFYVRNPDGTVPAMPEVVRAQSTGKTESKARSDAIQLSLAMYEDLKIAVGAKVEDIVPETRAFHDKKQRPNWIAQRCWRWDQPEHPDTLTWLPATWPRPRVKINGSTVKVPAALAWDPSKTNSTGDAWTCRGAIYYHIRYGSGDYGPLIEHVDERSGLAGPETAATSELRKALLEHAKAHASRATDDERQFTLDTHQGSLDATPIKCWQRTKKGAPVDWRGPTAW
jgi:hypothetical protein